MAADKLQYTELLQLIADIKACGETMKSNLNSCTALVRDDFNTGVGVWDGASATVYQVKFEELAEQIPNIVNRVTQQAESLQTAVGKFAAADGTLGGTPSGPSATFSTSVMK